MELGITNSRDVSYLDDGQTDHQLENMNKTHFCNVHIHQNPKIPEGEQNETTQPLLGQSSSPSTTNSASQSSPKKLQMSSSLQYLPSPKISNVSNTASFSGVIIPVKTGYGSTDNSPTSNNNSIPIRSKRSDMPQSRSSSSFELQQYYQSSFEDSEEEEEVSTSFSFYRSKEYSNRRGGRGSLRRILSKRRKKYLVKMFIIPFVVTCLLIFFIHHSTKNNRQQDKISPTSSSSGNNEMVIGMKKKRTSSLLSTLHPSHDLELPSFDRPLVTQPSSILYGSPKMTASSAASHEPFLQAKKQQSKQQQQPHTKKAKPTNAWYQNLLLLPSNAQPTNSQRVYSLPYILDVVGPIPGLRLHKPSVDASSKVISLNNVERHGLTLGISSSSLVEREKLSKAYSLQNGGEDSLTPLGISLQWDVDSITSLSSHLLYKDEEMKSTGGIGNFQKMTSSIVRGMPYVTMHYHFQSFLSDKLGEKNDSANTGSKYLRDSPKSTPQITETKVTTAAITASQLLPTVLSEIKLRSPPIIDDQYELPCSHSTTTTSFSTEKEKGENSVMKVEKEVKLIFDESDFTYLVFYSRPVYVHCLRTPQNDGIILQVLDFADKKEEEKNDVTLKSQRMEKEEEKEGEQEEVDLTVRIALVNQCTSGRNPIFCSQLTTPEDQNEYMDLLRKHADMYPGTNTRVEYEFHSSQEERVFQNDADKDGEDEVATMIFHWDAQNMKKRGKIDIVGAVASKEQSKKEEEEEILVFALPHHADSIISKEQGIEEDISAFVLKSLPSDEVNKEDYFCTSTLIGRACLVSSSTWTLREDILLLHNDNDNKQNVYPSSYATSTSHDFRAPRPPHPRLIQTLIGALSHDISFQLPEYYQRGAGDTYFSAKMLAKLGRIIIIADELRELASSSVFYSDNNDNKEESQKQKHEGTIQNESKYHKDAVHAAKKNANLLPNDKEFQSAISRLRSSVEIWINGTAETKFVYDSTYGGVVNCGCLFGWDGFKLTCMNQYPDCPAFTDPGLNFGNGFYNDHHFHYGYIIYAAAVVSHFDHEWGRKHFEQVLLFIRDIANPSPDDVHFPTFRHKDWYMGHSWASGISEPTPFNGRNQESSSESIAAYESIGLYGSAMMKAWEDNDEGLTDKDRTNKIAVSRQIRNIGRLLTATEIHSTDRYYHVRHNNDEEDEGWRIYPKQYTPHAIGMLWNTMAEFQTWFGGAAFSSYGIQLMPLTPIAEERDDLNWLKGMYNDFAGSCDVDHVCTDQGWSIVQFAALASVGHRDLAVENALSLQPSVFDSAGGNGHSLTNTLWYIATRPGVDKPLDLS